MLIDTHAHLFWDSFKKDLSEVLEKAQQAGVTTIFNVGTDVDTSNEALSQLDTLSKLNPNITFYSTIGIHPHDAFKYDTDQKLAEAINKLEQTYLSNPKKVIAVGECGLDFLFSNNPDWVPTEFSNQHLMDLQRKLFQAQIDLAKKLNLPLIIHCRDDRSKDPENSQAWNEVIKLTKDWKGIYHCYSGLPQTTSLILKKSPNFLVSFAGSLTYPKNEYLKDAVRFLPLEKICLETDCPFLPPQTIRGKRNEPSSVLEIARLISEIKGVSFKQIENQTSANVKNLVELI